MRQARLERREARAGAMKGQTTRACGAGTMRHSMGQGRRAEGFSLQVGESFLSGVHTATPYGRTVAAAGRAAGASSSLLAGEAARLRGKQRGLGGSLGGGERAEPPPPPGGGGGGGGDPESRAPGMGRGYWQWERGGVTRRRWARQRRGGVEPPPPAVVPVRTKPCAIEIGGGSAGAVLFCAKPLACRSM
jgi:hypothetical protein